VRFESVNGRYEKCDGREFILVSLHPESKFSKKKKKKHFKILEGRPNVLLYIYPLKYYNFYFITKRELKKKNQTIKFNK
jgi:hypothetical protein